MKHCIDSNNFDDQGVTENELRKLEMQINHEAIVFSLKIQVLDRFTRQRLQSGLVLCTYRIKIDGFDKKFMEKGRKDNKNLEPPIFTLLIRPGILFKKMPKRRDDDPSTHNVWLIMDGLKM